jgi:phenylpropionate dioxygenase-like ring-hydroxylating dioxygenase large terminal subunit
MSDEHANAEPGSARCPGTSWDDLAAADTNPVPSFLREEGYQYLGSEPLAASRYVSADFFKLECEKMWPNVWQFAAREEELPDPGDFVVYENAGRSYLLVRQHDGGVRAFHNVCLHRGRKIRDDSGVARELNCPFHGFSWHLDGTLKHIPCDWDFPHLKKKKMDLPEAQVGHWAGYIFIKENPGGPSLLEFLHPLPEQHQRWAHEECVTTMWAARVVRANWKLAAEAFMEAFHSVATHPQILPFAGDANTKYFVYGDHVNLALTPFAVISPHLARQQHSEQWIIDQMLKYNGRAVSSNLQVEIPPGGTARQAIAAANRQRFNETDGRDYAGISDSEMLDAYTYNVFPNFSPWGGFPPNIVYRWRPWPDENTALMEVRRLTRLPKGAPRPRSVPMRMLRDDESWTAVPEMAVQGIVFDQDWDNLPSIHQGLKYSKNGSIELANYQEIRVRHFARTLDKYLSR